MLCARCLHPRSRHPPPCATLRVPSRVRRPPQDLSPRASHIPTNGATSSSSGAPDVVPTMTDSTMRRGVRQMSCWAAWRRRVRICREGIASTSRRAKHPSSSWCRRLRTSWCTPRCAAAPHPFLSSALFPLFFPLTDAKVAAGQVFMMTPTLNLLEVRHKLGSQAHFTEVSTPIRCSSLPTPSPAAPSTVSY
jgi:hypothetical protein